MLFCFISATQRCRTHMPVTLACCHWHRTGNQLCNVGVCEYVLVIDQRCGFSPVLTHRTLRLPVESMHWPNSTLGDMQ